MKKIKKDVINERGYKCEICGISEWLNARLSLELDHIDGNSKNDDKNNLRLLCPNCHSQTSTYCGKNKNSGDSKVTDDELIEILRNTKNFRQAIISAGLSINSANYDRCAKLSQIEPKVKSTKNSQYGTMWINNGSCNKKIKATMIEEYLSLGWYIGRLIHEQKRPSVKGRFWITNGVDNKMINGEIPDNWWRGVAYKIKK